MTAVGEARYRDNWGVPAEEAHRLVGQFTWSADSRVLRFFDVVGTGPLYLLEADLGAVPWVISRYKVEVENHAAGEHEIVGAAPGAPKVFGLQREPGGRISRSAAGLETAEAIPQ
jgi:hypothetical protein